MAALLESPGEAPDQETPTLETSIRTISRWRARPRACRARAGRGGEQERMPCTLSLSLSLSLSHLSTYLPTTYLPTYLHTYLPTYLPTSPNLT